MKCSGKTITPTESDSRSLVTEKCYKGEKKKRKKREKNGKRKLHLMSPTHVFRSLYKSERLKRARLINFKTLCKEQ